MRFAIVDDIPAMRQELKDVIYEYCRIADTGADICCFDKGEAFIEAFVPYSYDIVFMDIYMKGMNGTDAASLMRQSDNRVILIFLHQAMTTWQMHSMYMHSTILKNHYLKSVCAVVWMMRSGLFRMMKHI